MLNKKCTKMIWNLRLLIKNLYLIRKCRGLLRLYLIKVEEELKIMGLKHQWPWCTQMYLMWEHAPQLSLSRPKKSLMMYLRLLVHSRIPQVIYPHNMYNSLALTTKEEQLWLKNLDSSKKIFRIEPLQAQVITKTWLIMYHPKET
jgi:hypothetical protein